MTCEKCGKELEVIKTDTGGAVLPCGCDSARLFIAKVLAYTPNPPLMVPDEYYARQIVEQANYIFKLAAALEIAIETLKDVRSEMSSQNVDRLWCIDQLSGSLEKINEVCK